MDNNDYTTTLMKDETGSSNHCLIIEIGNPLFNNIINQTIDYLTDGNPIDIQQFWHSKYNSYIVYDYEPTGIDGFYLEVNINSNNYNLLQYISHEIERLLDNLILLEKTLKLIPYKDKIHTEVII